MMLFHHINSNQEIHEYTWRMTHAWRKNSRMQVHTVLPQATVAKDIGNYLSIEAEQRMKQTSYEGSQIDRVW